MPTIRRILDEISRNITIIQNTTSADAVLNRLDSLPNTSTIATLATGNQVSNATNQQAILIGGVATKVDNVGSKVDAITAQIPNLATGNQINNAQSQQAILIGGVATKVDNVGSKVDAIPTATYNSQLNRIESNVGAIPRTNYSDNFLAVGSQLSAIQAVDSNIQGKVNGLPTATYNSQLDNIQARVVAISTNTYNTQLNRMEANQQNQANASALASVASQVSALQTTISNNLPSNSFVSLNASSATAIYNTNNPGGDLTYLLGVTDSQYTNPAPAKINPTSTVTADASNYPPTNLFSRGGNQGWYSTNTSNPSVVIDFGATRSITLNAIRMGSWNGQYPNAIAIEGSNNGSSWSAIATWNNPGFNSEYTYRAFSFTNSSGYRYIRLRQSGLNTAGNNSFSIWGLFLYGSITNP